MRVLVTGSQSLLGVAIVRHLSQHHEVRTLDLATGSGSAPDIVGDPRDRAVAERAVAECDAIVHAGTPAAAGASDLDQLDAATRGTYNLLTTGNAHRVVLLSTLRLLERHDPSWRVSEQWAPTPTTDVASLAPFLAEATVREVARVAPMVAVALRLGDIVTDDDLRSGTRNARWLHIDDAVAAVERALTFEPATPGPRTGWWVYHIVGGGDRPRFPVGQAGQAPFDLTASRDVTGGAPWPPAPLPEPTVTRLDDRLGGGARRVVIYGAGGPLAAITTEALARDHVLRLTDARAIADIAAQAKPQSPGSPLPRVLPPPHECQVVDVTDPEQVLAAAAGMDAIINCTVMRPHPVEAFRVNTLGAYNVMKAAVANGIRRVVHTGPQQVTLSYPAGYWYDFNLPDDVPSRPGDNLYYILTKFLGHEICRIFAEEYGLEVPTLYFSSFVNPSNPAPEPLGAFAFSISWEDSAAAMRQALRAHSFPHPFEVMHIVADLPHGKYRNETAKRLLQWQPRDLLDQHWRREGF